MSKVSRRGFIAASAAILPLSGLSSGALASFERTTIPDLKAVGWVSEVWADVLHYFKNLHLFWGQLKGEVTLDTKKINIIDPNIPLDDGKIYATRCFDTRGFTTSIPDTRVLLDAKRHEVIGLGILDTDEIIVNFGGENSRLFYADLVLLDQIAKHQPELLREEWVEGHLTA